MEIVLYRYNGKREVVDKLSSIETVDTINVTHRQPFDVTSPSFIIDINIADNVKTANYCAFNYHDRKYCCYVNLVNESTNMYRVNCFIDPLTTAYVNGCFDGVSDKILYSYKGYNDIIDDRIVYEHYPIRQSTQLYSGGLAYGIYAIVTNSVAIDPFNTNTAMTTNNKAIYITNRDGVDWLFDTILDQLALNEKKMYLGSIEGVYHLRGVTADMLFHFPRPAKFMLSTMCQPPLFLDISAYSKSIDIPNNIIMYKYDRQLTTTKYFDFTYNPSPRDYSSQISFNIDNLTEFNFTIEDIGGQESLRNIDNIGYKMYIDIAGGTYIFTLLINGKDILGLTSVVPITEKMAFLNPDAVDNLSQYTNALLSIGASAGKRSIAGKGGVLTSATGVAVNMATSAYNGATGTSWLSGAGGSVTAQLNHGIYVHLYKHRAKTNVSNFQSLYGKPDFNYRNISTLTGGYFMTENVKLKANSLPIAIITEAESTLNGGVWFTN